MTSVPDDTGIVRIPSRHPVSVTVDRLESLLRERGVLVFGRIDFSADAFRAGLAMRAEQLLIFGNPKAGTPLMQMQPAVGLDLPLKALVWEDSEGSAWIAYNSPEYIVRRHGLPATLSASLAVIAPLIERAASE